MKKRCLPPVKPLILLFFLLAGLVMPYKAISQSSENLLIAGYIEKFTHFIEWPDLQINNDSIFRIAVIGENKFDKALEEIFNKVKVKNKPVRIVYISSVDEIKNSRILIISGTANNYLKDILNYTKGKQILTISEKKGNALKGVIINLFLAGNHLRYEVNQSSLEKSGLKMSSLLLNSAIIVR